LAALVTGLDRLLLVLSTVLGGDNLYAAERTDNTHLRDFFFESIAHGIASKRPGQLLPIPSGDHDRNWVTGRKGIFQCLIQPPVQRELRIRIVDGTNSNSHLSIFPRIVALHEFHHNLLLSLLVLDGRQWPFEIRCAKPTPISGPLGLDRTERTLVRAWNA
jgi:hypothetical protein